MQTLMAVGIAGALGSLARYGVGLLAVRLLGERFAWGTLIVNLTGCFVIGVLMGLAEHSQLPRELRIALVTGFLGAYTTFSAFGFETWSYVERGDYALALSNVAANVVLGLLLVMLGLLLGRML